MTTARVIPEVPPTSVRCPELFPASLADQVLATKLRARRRWAARTALCLGLTGVLLVLMLVWKRDTAVQSGWMRSADRSAAALQAHLDQTGLLPATLPQTDSRAFNYASYYDRYYAQRVSRPVIIALSPALSLNLWADGRSVILYENGKVCAQWMTIAEFNAAYFGQIRDQERFEKERLNRAPLLP